MGGLASSPTRAQVGSSTKRRSQRKKRFEHKNDYSSEGPQHSSHRPILQLQLNPEMLEMVRQQVGSSGEVLVPRSTLRVLAEKAATYENLFPRQQRFGSSSSSSSNHTHYSRHLSTSSHDSMVLLQIVEDKQALLISERSSGDYDHLLPKGDFSHLCACTYGPLVDGGGGGEGQGEGMGWREEAGSDDHAATMEYGRGRTGSVLMTSGLTSEELKQRILYHQAPPMERQDSFRRSRSASTLATYQLTSAGDDYQPSTRTRHMLHSTSEVDSEEDSDWTFGESIIRTLSQRDIRLFDFENPQSQSEHAVLEAWPELKEKLKQLESAESLDSGLDGLDERTAGDAPTVDGWCEL